MFYLRKSLFIFLSLILVAFNFSGCGKSIKSNDKAQPFDCFSVNFLDVGEGDCTFIYFPDGKTMLIDCAPPDEKISNSIINFIKGGGVSKIDYLVLTHPDFDHVGHALDIINAFEIGVAYLPDILEKHLSLFPIYKSVVDKVMEKQITVNVSDCLDVIVGQDYGIAFLSPTKKEFAEQQLYGF